MAEAPGHRLGQIIGDALEEAIKPVLWDFAYENNLYLDFKQQRPTRTGVKCSWTDDLGNSHDLDFVLERGGSATEVGLPAGFIESAWRRYTKHSRAKAQEIQGAILPLLAKYQHLKPFAGAVVAGEWTEGALTQLRSSGFSVLHIRYQEVVDAFARFGIDVAADESTSDAYLRDQVAIYEAMSGNAKMLLAETLRATAPAEFARFESALENTIRRTVDSVVVLPLFGDSLAFVRVEDAIDALRAFVPNASTRLVRFEVQIRYNNGDDIRASFHQAQDAVEFLESFAN